MEISNDVYADKYKIIKIGLGNVNITFQGHVRIKMDKEDLDPDGGDNIGGGEEGIDKYYPDGPYGCVERHGKIVNNLYTND